MSGSEWLCLQIYGSLGAVKSPLLDEMRNTQIPSGAIRPDG
jgi:hypothetical protein